MKNSKQIEKEKVVISVEVPIEVYFRLKFAAEENKYKDLSKYIRDHYFSCGDMKQEEMTI